MGRIERDRGRFVILWGSPDKRRRVVTNAEGWEGEGEPALECRSKAFVQLTIKCDISLTRIPW